MRKLIILSIISGILTACTSTTSLNYTTPVADFSPSEKPINNDILFIAPICNNECYQRYTTQSLSYDFNNSLIESAKQSNNYARIYQSFYQEEPTGAILDFTVKSERRVNFINKLLCTFTLGLIPNYTKTDYTFSCSLKNGAQSYNYNFVETTSTWHGLFVLGKERIKDRDEADKKVCDHIAQNVIEALHKQKIKLD